MRSSLRPLLTAFALAAVTGCFDAGGVGCSPIGANGVAGKASFDYTCATKADPACDDAPFAERSLPEAVALGARFGLTVSDDAPVEPVSTRAAEPAGRFFIARRAGMIGFVVSRDGEAIDAVRLRVVAPTGLGIGLARERAEPLGELALVTDYEPKALELRAFATGEIESSSRSATRALAGTVDVVWSIDDPEIASLSLGSNGTCTIQGKSRGTTILHARSGALTADVRVSVGTIVTPSDGGPDGDASDPDASDASDASDAGADQ